MRHRSLGFAGMIALALLLAGCAGSVPRAPSVAPHGTYKVGEPYEINGTWYYPAEDWNYDETGIASWYGAEFHGNRTADGEIFNANAVSAAHRTLPMPSIVEVTNLENGRSIQVRINDRGPFARGRIIDLSRRAAQLLGFEQAGTAKVRVKLLVPQSIQVASLAGRTGPDPQLGEDRPRASPVTKVAAEALPGSPGGTAAPPPPSPIPSLPRAATAPQPVSEQVTMVPVKPSAIYIQAGAFASIDRAWRLKTRLERYGRVSISDATVSGLLLYRVRLGPVATVGEADALLDRVSATSPDARIVVN
jgi:peptidoglycan lytic transglycosylase